MGHPYEKSAYNIVHVLTCVVKWVVLQSNSFHLPLNPLSTV